MSAPFSLDDALEWMPTILESATQYYFHVLWNTPQGGLGRAYLAGRHISIAAAKEFRVGFAPPSWNATQRHLIAQGFPLEAIEAVGLVVRRKSGNGYFDRFRSRIVFPLTNGGSVVSVAGRSVLPEDTGPKYARTRCTPFSQAMPALFGLDLAASSLGPTGRVLLVEGFFDAMALRQAGLRSVVSLSGTSISEDELDLLARHGARAVYFLFDGDDGGRASARHLAERLRHGPLPSSFAFCDDGEDPDQRLHTKGVSSVVARALQGMDSADLIIDAVPDARRSSIERRVSMLNDLLARLAHPGRPLTDQHLARIARLFDVDVHTVRRASRSAG